jgi:hypothetical protein
MATDRVHHGHLTFRTARPETSRMHTRLREGVGELMKPGLLRLAS